MHRRGKLSSAVCLGIGAATLSLLSYVPPSHSRAADDDRRFEARLDLVPPPPQTCLTGPEHAVFAGGAIAVGPGLLEQRQLSHVVQLVVPGGRCKSGSDVDSGGP